MSRIVVTVLALLSICSMPAVAADSDTSGSTSGAALATTSTRPAVTDVSTLRDDLTNRYPWLLGSSTAALKLRMVPLHADELADRASWAISALEAVTQELVGALVDQQRTTSDQQGDTQPAEHSAERLKAIVDIRNDLVTRTNIVLNALDEKGGDVSAHLAYVDAVTALEVGQVAVPVHTTDNDQPHDEPTLAERVSAAVAAVREMPPVHERPEPWAVSVEELDLELQPLRREQIDERANKWLDILQRELRERIRLDIALRSSATDDDQRQAIADEAARQQEIVQAIVQRVRVVLMALQKRGGEVKEYNDYIANATGQRLNLTNPSVLWAQVRAWLRSPTGGVKVGLNLVRFVLIIVAFWVVSWLVAKIAGAATRRMPNSSMLLYKFVYDLTRWTLMLVGVVVAIGSLGVSIGPLLAAIGAAGLVIGLALQGTLSNFASGVMILLTRPFDVGDVINAGGVFGKVDAMNSVSTRVLTFDNQVHIVPNNQVWNGVITNVTKQSTRRVDMVFGIGYADDIAKAQAILEDIVSNDTRVLSDPQPVIRVNELGDSSVNLICRPWVNTGDYWDVYWDITRRVKERFDAEGVSIPFPQRDVHIYNETPKPSESTA